MIIASDPNTLHLLLTRNRPILWSWRAIYDSTVAHSTLHTTCWRVKAWSPN